MVVAHVDAGGLGMPDRDYYLKTEPRFVEARAKYLEHVQKMFELAGDAPAAAKAKADSIFASKSAWRKPPRTTLALRDPEAAGPQDAFADCRSTPELSTGPYFDARPAADASTSPAGFLQPLDKSWRRRRAHGALPEWKVLHNAAAAVQALRRAELRFYGKYLTGATTISRAAIRCRRTHRQPVGEALGQTYRPTNTSRRKPRRACRRW
jgi:endothelin-converting enzyme/putative endopeptidase